MQFLRYWIQPDVGDPLPAIGCGFRAVLAQVGKKWVRVKPASEINSDASRIALTTWAAIPKLRVAPGESPAGRVLVKGLDNATVTRDKAAGNAATVKAVAKPVRRRASKRAISDKG